MRRRVAGPSSPPSPGYLYRLFFSCMICTRFLSGIVDLDYMVLKDFSKTGPPHRPPDPRHPPVNAPMTRSAHGIRPFAVYLLVKKRFEGLTPFLHLVILPGHVGVL